MGATIIGSGINVTTGVGIETSPIASPVAIYGDGTYADSYWNLSGTTLVPDNLSFKLGLGSVATGDLSDYILLQDDSLNEVKRVAASSVAAASHTQAWSTITGTPTTLSGYGITDNLQPLDADLTAIAALGFTTTAFLKKTAANTWALDTNTYSVSSHTHAGYANATHSHTAADLPTATTGSKGLVQVGSGLSVDGNGVVSVTSSGGVVTWGDITGSLSENSTITTALGLKAPLGAPIFTTSFGFSDWRFVPSGTDLLIQYNGTSKGKLSSSGVLTAVDDVVAFGTI